MHSKNLAGVLIAACCAVGAAMAQTSGSTAGTDTAPAKVNHGGDAWTGNRTGQVKGPAACPPALVGRERACMPGEAKKEPPRPVEEARALGAGPAHLRPRGARN